LSAAGAAWIENKMNDEQTVAELLKCGFSELQARAGIRCGFKCEYCDRFLLASIEDYDNWQWDHLEPSSKGGKDDDANGAIACKLCNYMKRAFRPSRSLAQLGREAYIAEIRNFLTSIRVNKLEKLNCVRRVAGYEPLASAGGAI
jgi:hypothetical protein